MKILKCNCTDTNCPVYKKCCFLPTVYFSHPYNDNVDLIFIGQGGGKEERELHLPFVGKAGKRLFNLEKYCIKLYEPFGFAHSNTIRDNPERNRVPTNKEFYHCNKYLLKDINWLVKHKNLKVLIPLGNSSKELILGIKEPMKKVHGKIYKYKNLLIVPTYHPSAMIRNNYEFNENNLQGYEKDFVEDMGKIMKYINVT